MQQLRFYSPQWLYSTCFGRQSHPSSGVHMLYMATGNPAHLGCKFLSDIASCWTYFTTITILFSLNNINQLVCEMRRTGFCELGTDPWASFRWISRFEIIKPSASKGPSVYRVTQYRNYNPLATDEVCEEYEEGGLGGGGGASKLSSVKNQSLRLVHCELMATPRRRPRGLGPSTTPGHSTTLNSSCATKCNFLFALQRNHLQVLYCGTLLSCSTVLWLRSIFVLGSAVLTINL